MLEKMHKTKSGIPLEIIPGAVHNANSYRPDIINPVIEKFLSDNHI